MSRIRRAARPAAIVLLAAALPPAIPASAPAAEASTPLVRIAELAAGKPVRTPDYRRFERLFGQALSPDGRWLAWTISRQDGTGAVHLRDLEAAADPAGDDAAAAGPDGGGESEGGSGADGSPAGTSVFPEGSRPAFSPDGRWFMVIEGVSDDERERLRERNRPVPSVLVLRELATGETERLEDVISADFSDDGAFLLLRRRGGTGVVVRDLEAGTHTTFAGVTTAQWSDEGSLLAMVVAPGTDAERSLQVFDPATGRIRPLDSGGDGYAGLTWREDAFDLAVMRRRAFEQGEDDTHVVHVWRGLDGEVEHLAWDHLDESVGLDDVRVVTWGGLRWSPDGTRLVFGTDPWEQRPTRLADGDEDDAADGDGDGDGDADPAAPPPARADGDGDGDGDDRRRTLRETLDEAAGVDVWHTEDVRIIPLQRRQAERDRRRHELGMLHLPAPGTAAAEDAAGPRFVMLGDAETDRLVLTEPMNRALALVDEPHVEQQRFGPALYDVHLVDVETGERTRIAEAVKYVYGTAPDGQAVLWQEDGHVLATDLRSLETVNLTEDLPVGFVNTQITSLTDEKPIWGIGGWTRDSGHVVLYDEFDAWLVARDGSGAERLTDGRDEMIRYRLQEPIVRDAEDEEDHLDPGEPWMLSMYGERSKKRGVAVRSPEGEVSVLRWVDRQLGGLVKARDADLHAWTEEAFDVPPRLMVSGGDLVAEEPLVTTNDWLAEHAWGRAELVDFVNDRGEDMQATLMYPAGYVPGKRYPMVVYIYERLTQGIHRFVTPSETSPYNAGVFTSEGYFVLMPDITYRPQEPGVSAGECVVPAVEAVLERGIVDPERIGIMGHSWGAYQAAWLVTHTDVFAAGVAGAPLTNMISMSMSVYWNSGQTNAWIFHESQGRMDRPFWDDLETYVRNSPIFRVDEMRAPLLVAFGDEDGAVDWQQGIEMYNAARLAGTNLVMLVYEGENHGLRQQANRVDYHHRIREWFDHYLKGAPADRWILEGVDLLERQRELEEREQRPTRGGSIGTRPGTDRSR